MLGIEFLKSDMERLDNPEYFMKDFECIQLMGFFDSIAGMKQINQKRNQLNYFYDRFLNYKKIDDGIYVQLKWIIFLHKTIVKYVPNSPLYGFTLKALQLNLQLMVTYHKNSNKYEKYLIDFLVKPYIQYLCKFCLLNMPDQTAKYDEKSATQLFITKQQQQQNCQSTKDKIPHENQNVYIKLVSWYRKYNFITEALQTFEQILVEVKNYFNVCFPFLNTITKLIIQDLKSLSFKLKFSYRSLKQSNVTVLQIDQLQSRIKLFSSNHSQPEIKLLQLDSQNYDLTKKQIQQFLESPLKPFQVRLFNKKSLVSPVPLKQ